MEPLLVCGAIGFGIWWLGRRSGVASVSRRQSSAQQHAASRTRARAEAQRQSTLRVANNQARNLQLALLRLESAPDFRRAASFASAAKAVPLEFRQRQFRRFRSKLASYFASKLAAGGDAEILTESLASLLQALGIASFEADYLRAEAERNVAVARRPAPTAGYAQQLAAIQRDHEQWIAAIRELPNTDEDTRERLLEAEQTRYGEALDRLGANDPDAGNQRPRREHP